MEDVDEDSPSVVVLTALSVEYQAIREHLGALQEIWHQSGTLFEVGTLLGTSRRVALAQIGEGNLPAAVLAERAIAKFAPEALLFVGIAGALGEDLELGDVIVSTRVHPYHGGKEDDQGFHARPRSFEAPHRLLQLAYHIDRTRSWIGLLPEKSAQE